METFCFSTDLITLMLHLPYLDRGRLSSIGRVERMGGRGRGQSADVSDIAYHVFIASNP